MRFAILAVGMAVTLPVATAAGQQPRESRPSVAFTAGGSSLPDAIGSQCGGSINGSGGGGGPELAGEVLIRPRRRLAIQLDTRVMGQIQSGCFLVLPGVDTTYDRRMRHDALVTSTARLGFEATSGPSVIRATAGAGVVWGRVHPLPVAVIGLALRARPGKAGVLLELERMQTRVHAQENRRDAYGGPTVTRSIVFYPAWRAIRLGAEFPIGGGA
jgi:hypothetical protein